MLQGRIPRNKHNEEYMKDIVREAKKALAEPDLSLPYTEYVKFGTTGERVGYEAHYIRHRKRLGLFALMCLWEENDEPYFNALLNTIWSILDEYSWALPAHLLTVPMDLKYRRLDLFAAETSFALYDIYCLLGNRFPEEVSFRIKTEVRRRILDSFFTEGEINYPHSNWSAVQLSGVLSALSLVGTPEEIEKATPKMLEIASYFTDSYPEDGCCLEGALYWLFGFGYYCFDADLFRCLTNGKVDLLADGKCRKMANYWTKITLSGNNVLPYSDAPHHCNFHIGLLHFLKKRFPEISVPDDKYEMKYGEDTRYRLPDILRDLYWYDETIESSDPHDAVVDFPSAQWYLRRGDVIFSIKGGHNKEPHNHLDVGSFIIFKNDKFYCDDPGWGEYFKDYFGPHRYENVICSTEGHSVPKVNGLSQRETDAEQKCQVINITDNKIVLDIGIAYGDGISLYRTLERKDGSLILTDDCKTGEPISQRIVSLLKPNMEGNTVSIDEMVITSEHPVTISITETSFTPRRIISAGDTFTNVPLYLIDFIPSQPISENRLYFDFRG